MEKTPDKRAESNRPTNYANSCGCGESNTTDSTRQQSEEYEFEKICVKRPILKMQGFKAFKQIENPRVLIYIKPWDDEVFVSFLELLHYLHSRRESNKVIVFVEQWLHDKVCESREARKKFEINADELQTFNPQDEALKNTIQYLLTLGGDGTILYAAKQFHGSYIPVIIPFALGSLGYLCSFEFEEHQCVLDTMFFKEFSGNKCQDPNLDIRMRLKISVEGGDPVKQVYKGGQFENFELIKIQDYHVVNEIVVDRGPHPNAIQIEIYLDNYFFTMAVGDGLIVSTPTGSTAYNMAAGGSIVQTSVPAMSLTPLAPHSLSFRPLILPEDVTIKLRKPEDGRSSAWVSLDGATRFQLKDGEAITIRASENPIAFVTNPFDHPIALWSQKLTKLLNWNMRPYQKPLKKSDLILSNHSSDSLGSK